MASTQSSDEQEPSTPAVAPAPMEIQPPPPAEEAPSEGNTFSMGGVVGGNIHEAGSFAKERAAELRLSVAEGNWSLRIFVLLAALAMITTSLIGLISDVYRIDTISAIIDIYCMILGVIMIILEYGHQLSFFAAIQPSLYRNALFLRFVWGRGLFYFVAGTIEISQRHYMNIIVGSLVCLLGFAFAIIGRSASQKLAEARRSTFTMEDLRSKFNESDEEMKGSLDMNQFSSFIKLLGMDMNRREVETTFLQLEEDGRIAFEVIVEWWNTEATENFSVIPGDYQHMA
ncbi:unnamed protein product [Cylindrotheca closterium]|uniref:EF-hand domain-containing protein n=1 Tax=Cylindrotheca closterium TaxID=2856 RepID=A0AAD2PXD5_9STRA|nr:unnamed protein product [Cylindrotheca closterium]